MPVSALKTVAKYWALENLSFSAVAMTLVPASSIFAAIFMRQVRRYACGGKPAAPEKCFSLSEQNTGSLPFSGLTAGVGIVWD